jgi:hypothetical protein
MLMHRIEAKPSSAPDICATRPRSVQRRVGQQLAPLPLRGQPLGLPPVSYDPLLTKTVLITADGRAGGGTEVPAASGDRGPI